MKQKEENENLINEYMEIINKLKKALNKQGWDGRWYRRAYTDDGHVLGSSENEECRIDSIAQSWASISNALKETPLRSPRAEDAVPSFAIRPTVKDC